MTTAPTRGIDVSDENQKMAYVSRVHCGCMNGACVDDEHRKDTARWVREMIAAGYTVDRVTVETVRRRLFVECGPDCGLKAESRPT